MSLHKTHYPVYKDGKLIKLVRKEMKVRGKRSYIKAQAKDIAIRFVIVFGVGLVLLAVALTSY